MKIYKGFLIFLIFFILVGCQNESTLLEQTTNENNSIEKTEETTTQKTEETSTE